VQCRIQEAHFAEDKSLEGFNWKFNPKAFDRRQPAWSPSVGKSSGQLGTSLHGNRFRHETDRGVTMRLEQWIYTIPLRLRSLFCRITVG
jgi:hypothetical protein